MKVSGGISTLLSCTCTHTPSFVIYILPDSLIKKFSIVVLVDIAPPPPLFS